MTNDLEKAIVAREDAARSEASALHRISPLPKATFCLAFLILTVSFPRYDVVGSALFAAAPCLFALAGRLSLKKLCRRSLAALPFVFCAGIANCFFDSAQVEILPGAFMQGGAASLLVLTAKTFAAVGMALVLTATTQFSEIAGALHRLHAPCVLILQIQLSFRYLGLVLEEARNTTNAYFLRNPARRIVPLSDWGSLIGRLFLRTVERAESVWKAMQCRLFHAGRPLPAASGSSWREWIGTVFAIIALFILRVAL